MKTLPVYCAIVQLIAHVSACSTPGAPDSDTAATKPAPRPVVTPPATTPVAPPRPLEPTANKGDQPLLDIAGHARVRGDYEQALALLERAQRIDPDSAEIYLAMARTHQASGDSSQARAVAERGLLYCNGRAECDALRGLAR